MGKRKSRNLLLLARTWIRLNHVATCMVVAGQTKKLRRMAGVDACDHLLYIPYWPEEPYRLERLESPVARSAPEGIRNSTIGARHSRVAHVDKSKRNNEKDEMFCPFQMTTFHIRRHPGLYIYIQVPSVSSSWSPSLYAQMSERDASLKRWNLLTDL